MELFCWMLYIFAVLLFAYALVRKRYAYWQNHGVPFIKPIFPWGNIKGLMQNVHLADTANDFYTQMKGCGPFMGIYTLFRPVVFTLDLDFIKNVLIKDFHSFENRGAYYNERDDPLSAHLIAIESKAWRRLRSKLTPTFTSGKMKYMFSTMQSVAERFEEHLRMNLMDDGRTTKSVEVRELLGRFTTDVIGTCAFGIECNSLTDPNAQFLRMGLKVFGAPRYNPLIALLIEAYPKAARALRIKILPDDVAAFFMSLVQDTVEYREANSVQRNDFMDLLIKLKNQKADETNADEDVQPVTLNEIAAQAFLFFLAGFETSSSALTFALYELAANPDIQHRLQVETDQVLAKHDGKLTYDALMEMKYLDQVINETLRKYPPAALMVRCATQPYHVAEYNYDIPVGQQLWIPVYAIHHDPELYPDPSVFDPQRFSDEQVAARHPMAFLPFSHGPRNCIGMRFAFLEMRICLVMLLRNFTFAVGAQTTQPISLNPAIFFLAPKNGMWLDIKMR